MISLTHQCSRKASAIAVTKCDLFCVSKEDLIYLIRQFPQEAQQIKNNAFDRCKFFEEERRRIEVSSPHPVFKKLLDDSRLPPWSTLKTKPTARKDEQTDQVNQEQSISEKEEHRTEEDRLGLQKQESSRFDSLLMKEILAAQDPLPPQCTEISNFFSTLPSLDDVLLHPQHQDSSPKKRTKSSNFSKERESKFAKRKGEKFKLSEEDSHKVDEEVDSNGSRICERIEGLLGEIVSTMKEANEAQVELSRNMKQVNTKLSQIQNSQTLLLRK